MFFEIAHISDKLTDFTGTFTYGLLPFGVHAYFGKRLTLNPLENYKFQGKNNDSSKYQISSSFFCSAIKYVMNCYME